MEANNLYNEVLAECKECIKTWKNEHGDVLPIQYGDYINHCWNYGGDRLHSAIDMLMTESVEEEVTPILEFELMVENVGVTMANRIRIGNMIAEIRQSKGLSLRQLAELSGVTSQNITKIEHGRYNVSIDILNKLLEALGCKMNIERVAE